MDLLEEINRRQKCVVQITLTTFDEELCSILEPNVSGTKARVDVLKECQRRGIPTVVWLSPILPFIMIRRKPFVASCYCIEAGVHGIVNFGFGLTLREGDREYFYAQLDKHFPGMKQRYNRRLRPFLRVHKPQQRSPDAHLQRHLPGAWHFVRSPHRVPLPGRAAAGTASDFHV